MQLLYDPSCPSIGWLVGRSVSLSKFPYRTGSCLCCCCCCLIVDVVVVLASGHLVRTPAWKNLHFSDKKTAQASNHHTDQIFLIVRSNKELLLDSNFNIYIHAYVCIIYKISAPIEAWEVKLEIMTHRRTWEVIGEFHYWDYVQMYNEYVLLTSR